MLAAEGRATMALALPDVCADIEAWVKSDYHTLSQGTQAFFKQTEAIDKIVGPKKESLNKAILRILKPYESGHDRRLARQTNHLYEIVGRRILKGFSKTFKNLVHALGIK
jgi:hypothetical protein